MMIDFIIPLVPVPCPRPRVTRGGVTYYPKRYRDYKRDCTLCIKNNIPSLVISEVKLLECLFVLPRPKYMSRGYSPNLIPHTKRPDLDNLLKTLNDCLEGAGILSNDCIISDIIASKRYAERDGIGARTEVKIQTYRGKNENV